MITVLRGWAFRPLPTSTTTEAVRAARAEILDQVYTAHPERFVRKPPQPPKLPQAAWINKPPDDEKPEVTADTTLTRPPSRVSSRLTGAAASTPSTESAESGPRRP